ncbi:hypothetical protein GCM10009807_24230 [Microbacterium lacus]|uniref:Lipoprotein n=2 Tax=Microbacterium lacus TaxID=415217 RepID=A0ABN2GZQ5_9MICO
MKTIGAVAALVSILPFTGCAADAMPSEVLSPSEPSVAELPVELEGTWCSALDDDDCLSFTQLGVESPGAWISIPGGLSATERTTFALCSPVAASDADCAGAIANFYEYFPPGVAFNCQETVDRINLESAGVLQIRGCSPDYTDLHKTEKARLVDVTDHLGDPYEDSPPYYLSE